MARDAAPSGTGSHSSRRDVLRRWATLAGLGVTGSLAGCGNLLASGGDNGGGSDALDAVPGDADATLLVDAGEMLADDRALSGVDAALEGTGGETGAGSESDVPESVDAALSRFEDRTGLDSSGLTRAIGFTRVVADPDADLGVALSEADAGAVLETEWTAADVASALDRAGVDYEETTHRERTVYLAPEGAVGVLADGRFAAGRESAVESAIGVAAGETESVDGQPRRAFGVSPEGFVRFGFDVPQAEIPTDGIDPRLQTVASVTTVHGAVSREGDGYTLTVGLTATGGEAASELRAIADAGLAQARQAGDGESSAFLDAVEVSRNGRTVTLTADVDGEMFERAVSVAVGAALSGVVPAPVA